MFERCPNCGYIDYTGLSYCDCTWSEQLAAQRILERERRRKGIKKVLVDHTRSLKRDRGQK